MNKIDDFPVPLFIKFSQMNRYVKYFNDSKYMNFEQNTIWNETSNLLAKKLIVNPYIMINTSKLI